MNLMAEILIQVIIAFLAGSLLLGLHRKVMARVQKRPGPPIVQQLIHSLKFFFKETAFPKTVSKVFYIGIVFILALIWIVGVIVGPVAHDSLLILFGVYAVYKIVEHNSGSSSGSPYGKLSCVLSGNRHNEHWRNYHIPISSWSFDIFNSVSSFNVLYVNHYKIPILSICNYKGQGFDFRI